MRGIFSTPAAAWMKLDQAFQQRNESLFQWSDRLNRIGDSIFRLDVGGRNSIETRLVSKFCFAACDRETGVKTMEQGPPKTLEEAVESMRWFQHVQGAAVNSGAERPRAHVRGWSPDRDSWDRHNGSGGAMDILQKGIRWRVAGLWTYYRRESAGERRGYGHTTEGNPLGSGGALTYYRRESAGERRGYGHTTEGNPLGSGGAMEILQKGIRWGAAGTSEGNPLAGTSEGNPLGSGRVMEITQKGIRWGAAGLWKYHRRESAGERRGCGNTTKGNPLGSGGVVGIPQKGIRWGAAGDNIKG